MNIKQIKVGLSFKKRKEKKVEDKKETMIESKMIWHTKSYYSKHYCLLFWLLFYYHPQHSSLLKDPRQLFCDYWGYGVRSQICFPLLSCTYFTCISKLNETALWNQYPPFSSSFSSKVCKSSILWKLCLHANPFFYLQSSFCNQISLLVNEEFKKDLYWIIYYWRG